MIVCESGKVDFGSKTSAKKAIERITWDGVKIVAYRCSRCHRWHIGDLNQIMKGREVVK